MGPAINAPFFKSRPRRRGYSSFRSRTRALGFHWFPPLPTPISVCGALASSLPFGVRLAIGTTLPRLGKAPSQVRDSTIDRWNFSDTTKPRGRGSPTSDSPRLGKWSSALCGACMSRFGSREAGWLLGQSRTAAGSNWRQTG
jgi:hypothetical protein